MQAKTQLNIDYNYHVINHMPQIGPHKRRKDPHLSFTFAFPMEEIMKASAPWKLKGKSWTFLISSLDPKANFPAGWSEEFQADALSQGGEFIGGLGSVMVVSYAESPVGPYNELIYIPGRFKYSDGSKSFRITRIYVSTKESTLNGRRNWNIPKLTADFVIDTSADGSTDIAVSQPGCTTPFFQATVRPIPVLSSLSIPSSTAILGQLLNLMQPPLPAGKNPEDVGTEQWANLTPALRGSLSVRKLIPVKIGDGASYPQVKPWSLALVTDNLELDFGLARFSPVV
ncbi:unnamed protein product [Mycena citricolor]|uniref:Acetoacetate decarboxylase n=1 Tax=Mycena citricolor TaxID=2018698 RepID=A0AAD2HHB4_9AGAR|nr:unnamed protein product [Mycena citricolor]